MGISNADLEKSKIKNCLGIESTAHTLGLGIINSEGTIIKQVKKTYVPKHGGIHPRKASEHHAKFADLLIDKIKDIGNYDLDILDYIAFSQGPGLGPCLRLGAVLARILSQSLGIPLIGVNHCLAHVEIGKLFCNVKDPICLYVSGGNTMVIGFEGGKYRIFGETLDIAIGNMLDVFGREAGLRHPGGPKIEKLAKNTDKFIELPYIVKGMDLSYSGLLTAAVSKLKDPVELKNICYSLQEVSFAMLVEVTERAIAHTEKKDILLTGGVAANTRLQEMLKMMGEEHGVNFHVVPKNLAGDNGIMIAWTGLLQAEYGNIVDIKNSHILPKWRLDEIKIPWMK
ncbi:MAG: bifunctional N(6)-L-threonylcarbamoyladenine synthase/serine/threonine protein kinase [Candidatus Lokiarchaeota archaeon]|nr:bifunctional N(6)-L-threonylcarbamoyladenine synthase/serine/threonine protein kinase [Candidatus Lokiarchaeota archaeon]